MTAKMIKKIEYIGKRKRKKEKEREKERKKMYGWYSSECCEETGHWMQYETPTGEIVCITSVTEEKDGNIFSWSDIKYIGEITKIVSRHQKPPKGYYRLLSKDLKSLNIK